MKRAVVRIAICLIVLGVSAWIAVQLARRDEPSFAGKRISTYLQQMHLVDDGTNRELRYRSFQEATNALRKMGPAAVKWLAKHIENAKPAKGRFYDRILARLPSRIRDIFPAPKQSDGLLNRGVVEGLTYCGPSAVPVLTNYLDPSRYDGGVREEIYGVFFWSPFLEYAQPAIPALLSQALSTNDRDRVMAAWALVHIDSQYYDLAVSNFVAALTDTNSIIRVTAANYLGNMTPSPTQAIPALEKATTDPNPRLQREAKTALKRLKRP